MPKAHDPAAEIGTAADVLAVDQAVAVAMGTGYVWGVELDYDPYHGALVREGKRMPYPTTLPEIVARFKYLAQAQDFAKSFADDHRVTVRVRREGWKTPGKP